MNRTLPSILLALAMGAQAAPVIGVRADAAGHTINPGIYGINALSTSRSGYLAADSAMLGSDRMGGNRMTGYNWENNFSSAGSDWQHSSDNWMTQSPLATPSTTGGSVASFVERNLGLGRAPIVQLQMAGYVAGDGAGTVTPAEAAPSARWKKVVFAKGAPFTLTPSTTDSFVYLDEEVNFLVRKFGRADQGGVPYYQLDNEPALWPSTHARIHPQNLSMAELLNNSEALAKAVKAVDPSVKVIGLESFGAMEMWNCGSAAATGGWTECADWSTYKSKYDWALAAYLGEMKKRSATAGTRLIDVLGIHWYPEDKGDSRINAGSVMDGGTAKDIEARLQAPRSLWDSTYLENSWVTGMTGNKPVHILTRTRKSIDTAWPGTRLALTEYNYGGENHWSGALALADVLGVFGKLDLEAANLHTAFTGRLEAAFRLYRNFDGKGNGFGDLHVPTDNPDRVSFSTYASLDSKNPKLLHVVAINKSVEAKPVTFSLSGKIWQSAVAYGFSTDSVITRLADPAAVSASGFDYVLPATSAVHFVVSTDAQVSLPSPDLVALQVEIIGQGSVTRSIRTALLPRGTVVKLDAVPAEGWTFGGWAMGASGKESSLSLVMDGPRTVQATFLSSVNLITNGDFSAGVSGWTPSAWSQDGAAKGTPSAADGSLSYVVTNGGTETWNVQIFQTAVPFVKGVTYTLSFDGWANTARSIQAYANLGAVNEVVSLGTSTKRYTYTFVSDSTESGKLSFDIGGAGTSGTTIHLDNVSIKAAVPGTGIASRSARPAAVFQQGRFLTVSGSGNLVLCDAQGREVLRREIQSAARVDLSSLSRGLYIARFQGSRAMIRILD